MLPTAPNLNCWFSINRTAIFHNFQPGNRESSASQAAASVSCQTSNCLITSLLSDDLFVLKIAQIICITPWFLLYLSMKFINGTNRHQLTIFASSTLSANIMGDINYELKE
jgi:hypothetical protein